MNILKKKEDISEENISKENDLDIKHEVFDGFRIGITLKVIIEKDGEILKEIYAGVGDKIIVDGKEFTVEQQDMIIDLDD